jgi:molybdopterin-guanine dinucleotide biosynthesis protein A
MGVDKALIEVEGETLLDRVADRLRAAGADRILLATGTARRLGPRWEEQIGDDPDYGPHAGPLAGIVAGLRACDGPTLLLVAAVDLPHASPDLFRWLVGQWRGEPALVPVDASGRPQPLHAVYANHPSHRRGLLAVLDTRLRRGEHRVIEALDEIGARYVVAPGGLDTNWAENWNRPHPGWG